jgi:hypothetical protein
LASRLTNDGVDIVTVKELPGPADINRMMRYARSSDDAERRAVSGLEKSSDKTVIARRQRKAV